MNRKMVKTLTVLSFAIGFLMLGTVSGLAGDYNALEGVKHANTIFDFRDGKVGSAVIHLSLIHDTYKDQAIQGVSEKPEFVVVFMSSAVKLLSSNREAFSEADRKSLAKFDKTIKAMAADGIKLEICMFAADLLGVDPETIAPEIERIPNGWIASLGYQAKGYGMVPVY